MRIPHLALPLLASLGWLSTARADTPIPALPDWNVVLRFPWEFTFASGHSQIGLGGFGVDIEHRVDDHSYLGASADWGISLDLGDGSIANNESGPAAVNRFKGGVELRHVFHEGTAAASVNDGPYFPIPRHDWIGARAGVETIDGGDTHGYFGEVSIGADPDLGNVSFGVYLAAGVSVEPAAAYASHFAGANTGQILPAAPTATGDSGDLAGLYVGFGMRLALH